MRYLSLFSGIEAASTAWEPLGWQCAGFSEIEPGPCRLLAKRYPNVPNLGDVTKITELDIAMLGQLDLLVFGSPCQDLSVAGKQKGLSGARSGLFHTAINIVRWARIHCGLRWALWENVPGAFTSNKGADFAVVVALLGGDAEPAAVPAKTKQWKGGWGNEGCYLGAEAMVEWSTLDAQWFGVAQRRRRVFALADFGDWAGRPPVLLEPEGMRGDSAPRRGTQKDAPPRAAGGAGTHGAGAAVTLTGGGRRRGGYSYDDVPLVAFGGNNTSGPIDVATALNACASASGRLDFETETFVVHGQAVVAFQSSQSGVRVGHVHATLDSNNGSRRHHGVIAAGRPRRLTPLECERLQAFPDHYTALIGAADGPRYKALGNSMCVNVMRWIGRKVDFVHEFC